jgi:phosphoglucosamine mutase
MKNNKKIFGTDGVRSKANGEFMNPIFLTKLAIAIDKVIFQKNQDLNKRIIISKDTRRSGYMIESALSSSFMSLGIHSILTGPVPTAVIPFLMNYRGASVGINISASHNPFNDNGIKIFGPDGLKINDEIELEIEQILLNEEEFKYENLPYCLIDSKKIGHLGRIHNAHDLYTDYIKKTFIDNSSNIWDIDISNTKIVIDLANGAAYKIAPMIFKLFNIFDENLIILNNQPDGFNINFECGAVHPKKLQEQVKLHKADIGMAVDGDADRIVFVDENGLLIDNDKIIALCARIMKYLGFLYNSEVVINLTSNFGIEKYLEEFKISTKRVSIGDKHIMNAFNEYNLNFGGEKSGHIIFGDFMKGCDGILSGILILSLLKIASRLKLSGDFIPQEKNNFKISEIINTVNLLPQIAKNFDYGEKEGFDISILTNKDFLYQISRFEEDIKKNSNGYGRILIRKSGTEAKIRLIGEGLNEILIDDFLNKIIDIFKNYSNHRSFL